jgi:putative flavoprotein involved in K+ transport
VERIPVIVIGAGQAGLATSFHLTRHGIEHVVIDRGAIGDTWRTRRWDSFRLVSPNWLNRLPGGWYYGPNPEGFFDSAEMVHYLEGYARSFDAPIRTGQNVTRLRVATESKHGRSGFVVDTPAGTVAADAIVVASGAFGRPRVPALAERLPSWVRSVHTDDYHNPAVLPSGGVLVVGAGQAGLQIADELVKSGRPTWVSVGRHGWLPRKVYGRDQMYWRLENGDFQSVVAGPGATTAVYPFSGLARWGGDDFNVRTVYFDGVRLLGHLEAVEGSRVRFSSDLPDRLGDGDDYARTFVMRVRDFARGRGEDVPEPGLVSDWREVEMPEIETELDLERAGIGTVVWATGFQPDYDWIAIAGALAADRAPVQVRGVSPVDGLYFVGIHRMYEAAAGTVLGCGWVAEYVADQIAGRLSAGGV